MKKIITVLVLALMVQVSFAQEENVKKEESKSEDKNVGEKK